MELLQRPYKYSFHVLHTGFYTIFILFVRSFYKQILPSIIKQRKNKYFYIGCCLIALSSGYLIVHNIKQNPLGQLFAGTVRYMNRYNAFAENKKNGHP